MGRCMSKKENQQGKKDDNKDEGHSAEGVEWARRQT